MKKETAQILMEAAKCRARGVPYVRPVAHNVLPNLPFKNAMKRITKTVNRKRNKKVFRELVASYDLIYRFDPSLKEKITSQVPLKNR